MVTILSWALRVLALLAVVGSFILFNQIQGQLKERQERIDGLRTTISERDETIRQATNARDRALRDIDNVRSDLQAEQNRRQEVSRQLDTARSQLNERTEALRNEQAEVARFRERVTSLERDLLERDARPGVSDEADRRISELQNQVDALTDRNVQYERRVAELREANEALESEVARLTGDSQVVGSTLMGRVLRVDPENNLVVVNLGVQHRVRREQQLIAYRPDSDTSFTLQVQEVGPNFSITQLVGRTGTRSGFPRAGDEVANLF